MRLPISLSHGKCFALGIYGQVLGTGLGSATSSKWFSIIKPFYNELQMQRINQYTDCIPTHNIHTSGKIFLWLLKIRIWGLRPGRSDRVYDALHEANQEKIPSTTYSPQSSARNDC